MKRIFIVFLVFSIFSALILAVFYYMRSRNEKNELTLYGNVDVRQVDISYRVSGQINKMRFQEGDLVEPGEWMTELNPSPYDNQVLEARANLESLQVRLENSEKLLKRRRELVGIGGVSQETIDDAEASYHQLKADFQAAEAALAVSENNLSYTKAYAPEKGIVLTRVREPGAIVNPADPVYTLSILSPVWVRAYVSEPELGLVHFGMPAEVYTDTKAAPVYKGKVGFISPVAEFTPKNVQTTTLRTDLVYRLRIYIDDPGDYLKQGMPVTVKLKLPSKRTDGE